MTSSLITQIGFHPVNQPEDFLVGVPNQANQPLRIQTQNSDGVGENVSGSGQTVFIQMTSSSPTGRFDLSPAGAFSGATLNLTVTNGRQNSQDFFYRDTTPGTVTLTATVTAVANTGLSFNEKTSVTKFVRGVGDRLVFATQPSSADKDAVISPPVSVQVVDAAGNLDTASTRNVTLAIGNDPSGATLSGTTTVAAVNGIATFSDLRIDRAGVGYTLIASSDLPAPAMIAAESQPFNVDKLSQSIDFDELTDRTYGDSDLELRATSTSGFEVAFESLTPETCAVTNAVLTIEGAGRCSIEASQPGDPDHEAADDFVRSFFINKADAAIVVEPYDVIFDGQPHSAVLLSITGVKGETDSLVGTVDLSGTVHTNARAYPNDVWKFLGNENYNDTSGVVGNQISRARVTVNAGGGSAVYDGLEKSVGACVVHGPGFVGDLTCVNDRDSVGPDAGRYMIGSAVNGSDLSNFDISNIEGTFAIEKAPTVTTVSFEPGPRVYRGQAFAATTRVTGPGGLDRTVPVEYSGDCLNVTATDGCIAVASFPESANHLGSSGSSSITITKRPLNVTASSHVLRFGDAVPEVTPSIEGFVAGESMSVLDTLPTCSTAYTVGSPVGTYPTNCAGGLDNNYSFNGTFAAGSIIVHTVCSSFNGFLAPVGGANAFSSLSGPGGSFNTPLRTFKLNSTIPFKFTAVCGGAPLAAGVQTLTAQKYSNGVPVGDEVITLADDDSTPDNLFRFSDGQWHFNFKTKDLGDAAQGTWLFEAALFDGSTYSVWLAIRK